HIVIMGHRTATAVPEHGIVVISDSAGHIIKRKTLHHGRAYLTHSGCYPRMDARVYRVSIGRKRYPGPFGSRLVMVVYDLRKPLAIYFLGNGPRFGHVVHKPIAVVVVAHVVMIQPRRIGGLVWRIDMFEIPAGDNIHAIGIHHRHQQGNDILPDSLHLFGFFGGYFVVQLRGHLSVGQLVAVRALVEPHYSPALCGKLFSLFFVDTSPRHLFAYFTPTFQLLHIFFTGD